MIGYLKKGDVYWCKGDKKNGIRQPSRLAQGAVAGYAPGRPDTVEKNGNGRKGG